MTLTKQYYEIEGKLINDIVSERHRNHIKQQLISKTTGIPTRTLSTLEALAVPVSSAELLKIEADEQTVNSRAGRRTRPVVRKEPSFKEIYKLARASKYCLPWGLAELDNEFKKQLQYEEINYMLKYVLNKKYETPHFDDTKLLESIGLSRDEMFEYIDSKRKKLPLEEIYRFLSSDFGRSFISGADLIEIHYNWLTKRYNRRDDQDIDDEEEQDEE